jgi:hypothetical protein
MKTSLLLTAMAVNGAISTSNVHSVSQYPRNIEKRAMEEEVVTVTVCKLGALELPERICDYYVDKGVLKFVEDGSVALANDEPFEVSSLR